MALESDYLLTSKLFAGLRAKDVDYIIKESNPSSHAFKRGTVLWCEGEVVDGIGLLESGTLLCQRDIAGKKTQTIGVYVENDLFNIETGASRKRTSPVTVIAATSGSYIWFDNDNFLDNPSIPLKTIATVQANLLESLADQAIRCMKKSGIVAQSTVRERVFAYFGELYETRGAEVDIGMSQAMLAQYLCVDRSSLSEELNRMRREGLIDFEKNVFKLKYLET